MKPKKIGMRTIKTALAVSLAIFISQLLNLKSPLFVGIAAIISMKSSVSESLTAGKSRMLGTIFGAMVAIVFSYITPTNVLSIGIGIIIIIYVCNLLGWTNAIQLSSMVFLVIVLNYDEGSRLNYAIYRAADTLIGLIIGTLINYLVVPPDTYYEKLLKDSIIHMHYQIKKDLEDFFWNKEKISLENLQAFLNTTKEEYKILNKEIKLKIKKSNSINSFKANLERTINSIETIYNHLAVVFNMDSIPSLDENNKKSLEKIFEKELFEEEKTNSNEHVVYNYHVNKILEELETLDLIIGASSKTE